MRVSSLSDERVIRLLDRYFVPAWLSRDHYQQEGVFGPEKAELDRIDRERASRKLPGGTVCVFVLAADGSVLDTLPVQKAWKADALLPFLERIIAEQKLEPRRREAVKASAAPPPASPRPKTEGGQVFAVYTRSDARGQNRGVSHDHVELTVAEWRLLLPPEGSRAGASFRVPAEVAGKLLRYAYPPLPHWDVRQSKVMSVRLAGTVESLAGDEAKVRLEGSLELVYPAEGKPTDARVKATLAGTIRYSPRTRTLTAFGLISDSAEYVRYWDGKANPVPMAVAVELNQDPGRERP
jgi:hypothetical protein